MPLKVDVVAWGRYHRKLRRKVDAYRKLQAAQQRAVDEEEEQLTKHFVRLREQQMALAAAKLASQGKNTAIRRQCKPIVPPPRKPPPVMYSTLIRSPEDGACPVQRSSPSPPASARHTPRARQTPPMSARQQGPASTPQHARSTPSDGGPSAHLRQHTARRHGVYHPELEPMRMPDFQSLIGELFPNRMEDANFLAGLSSSEEKAKILSRTRHADAKAALLALETHAKERKLRATKRMMATRAAEIKQVTKDTAEELNLHLRAEPGLGNGSRRFPTIAT